MLLGLELQVLGPLDPETGIDSALIACGFALLVVLYWLLQQFQKFPQMVLYHRLQVESRKLFETLTASVYD